MVSFAIENLVSSRIVPNLLIISENQVKGLEGDEVEFLNFVSEKQTEIDKAREQENEEVLAEYRVSLNYLGM